MLIWLGVLLLVVCTYYLIKDPDPKVKRNCKILLVIAIALILFQGWLVPWLLSLLAA